MSQRAGSTIQGIPSSLSSRPVAEAPELEKIHRCPKKTNSDVHKQINFVSQ